MLDVSIEDRPNGVPNEHAACKRVVVEIEDENDGNVMTMTAEFDPDSGDNGEFRVVVDDECVYSYLFASNDD